MKKTVKKEQVTISMPTLDRIDLSILKLLQENARATVKEIATKVHLSTTPVHERIKRMEQSGVIKQYATLVDHTKVIKSINALNEVVECYNISGEFDFMLKVVEENMDSYYDFHVNRLSQIENMGNVQSVFVMGVIKQTHQLVW